VSDTTDLASADLLAEATGHSAETSTATTATEAEPARSRRRGAGLSTMLLSELQALAGTLGITGTARMRKGELVAAIEARQAGGNGAGQAPTAGADVPADPTPDAAPPTQTSLLSETAPEPAREPVAAEPTAQVAEPAAQVAEPAAQVAEPAAQVAESAAQVAESAAQVAESAAQVAEPAAQVAEPAAPAVEPATPAEPAAAAVPAEAPVTPSGTRESVNAQANGTPQAVAEVAGQLPLPGADTDLTALVAPSATEETRQDRPRRGASRPAGAPPADGGDQVAASPEAVTPAESTETRPPREGRQRQYGDRQRGGDGDRQQGDRQRGDGDRQQGERQQGDRPDRQRDRQGDRDRQNDRDRNERGDSGERGERPAAAQGGQGGGDRQRNNQGSRDGQSSRDGGNRDGGSRDGGNRDQGNRDGGQSRNQNADRNAGRDDDGDDDGFDSGNRRRRGRFRDRNRRSRTDRFTETAEPVIAEDDVLLPVAGILDILDNYAFIRTSGYLTGPNDVYVSLAQVRRYGLRRGDAVTGAVRQPKDGERRDKYNALVRLDTVNGTDAEQSKGRPEFTKLTPLYPQDRLRLETEPHLLTPRVIDLVMPIGKGQRALIVSPPKAGKTMILQAIANAITTNNPECHLMVVLVDERPEEVTDMQRSVKGEVIASTFDRPPSDHTTVAELSIERAKRLVELGHDVVVLLDSITRLGRAYNLAAPASGRILSGGVDSTALYPPKRFLGAARNIEHGGSLTILATALIETGSTMDTVIFEEFKGTGNAELVLSRKIADKRIFPAVDVDASGTRKEEILLAPDELAVIHKLRRVLHALDPQQALDLVLSRIKETRTNVEFLMQVQKTTVGPNNE
jgi:transcription termination factor Rho